MGATVMTFIEMTPDVVVTRDTAAGASFKGLPVFAVRQDVDVISESDGEFAALRVNEEGRLKVATKPALYPPTQQTITAISQTMPVDVSRASNITVHIKGGSVAGVGGNFAFEGSVDSTNGTDGKWFPIQAVLTNANTIVTSTGVLGLAIDTGHTAAWEMSVNAYAWFRVRSSAFTSGQYVVTALRGVYATEPIPAIQTHAVTMTSTTITALSPGTAAANLGKAEDAAHTSGDVGVMILGVRNDNLVTAPTSATGDYGSLSLDSSGAAFVRERYAQTTTVTRVNSSASNVTLQAANNARRGLTIFNDSTSVLYLKMGATATTTSFSVKLGPDEYYEIPANYSGIVDGIWASANGAAMVTEVS